jgi:hypothetical protein
MKFLLIDKKEGTQTLVDYPRWDKNPVEGLSDNLEYFIIDETNPKEEMVFGGYELTEEVSKEYTHLKIARKIWNPIIQEKQSVPVPMIVFDPEQEIRQLKEMIVILSTKAELTKEELTKFEVLKPKE